MQKRVAALDGLRGWAALFVIIYHSLLGFNSSLVTEVLNVPVSDLSGLVALSNKLMLAVFNGASAVVLFFVLSGAVLTLSLNSRRASHNQRSTLVAFVPTRLLRLYPTLIAAVLFGFLMAHLGIVGYPHYSLHDLINNSIFINPVINGATLTIQIEVLAIPFVMVTWMAYRAWGVIAPILAFVITMFCYEGSLPAVISFVGISLGAFAAGMIVADEGVGQLFARAQGKLLGVALALLVVVRVFQPGESVALRVEVVMLCATVVAVALRSHNLGLWGSFLNNRVSQFLGHISYSLYLWNVPILILLLSGVSNWKSSGFSGLATGCAIAVVTTLLTLPLAWLSARYIEQPSIRAGNKVANWIYQGLNKPSQSPTSEPPLKTSTVGHGRG
jgi:peptidoglycan/LPS O-acetylase OafA/YrhL